MMRGARTLGAVLATLVFCAAAFADGDVVSISLAPVAEDPVTIMLYRSFPFTLTDADGDSCTVVFEYSVDGANWEPGRPPCYAPSYQASPDGSTYVWNLVPSDYVGTPIANQDTYVWLRGTATDDDGSTTDQIGPFLLQNEPRGWFSDMAVPEWLELGCSFNVGFVLNLRNTWAAGGELDTQQSCTFFFYINGRLVATGWTHIPQTENYQVALAADGLDGLSPEYPLRVPDDLEFADEYIFEIRGDGLSLDFGSISATVQIADLISAEIVHTPVAGPKSAGEDIPITAQITDNQIVKSAGLKYRIPGGAWQDAAMANVGGDTYAGTIPGSAVTPPAVEYAIFAWDSRYAVDSPRGSLFGYEDGMPELPYSISVEDNRAPLVSGVAAVPTAIKAGVDDWLSVSATGDDSTRGNSNISAAEYFVGPDPGAGNGNAMQAADGAFDSPVEALTATIGTSSWTAGSARRINVRARDGSGNWTSPVAHIDVPVVDGTPPSSPPEITAGRGADFREVVSQGWTTLGSVAPEEESLVLDLESSESIGAVGMSVPRPPLYFPVDFSMEASGDGANWTPIGKAVSFGRRAGSHLWQCDPSEYRYVRIRAWSLLDRSDGHYYVRIPEVSVYESLAGNGVIASWTATADDANDGSSGPATVYDLRYSASPIAEVNWGAATQVPNEPVPSAKGTAESCTFSVGTLTTVYVGLKIGDEAGNWSTLAASGPVSTSADGFISISPEDSSSLEPDSAPPTFQFQMNPDAGACFISFSGCAGFPPRPTMGEDGETCRTLRFPLRSGAVAWTPTATQWTSIRKLVHTSGTLHWRLEGACPDYGAVYGACRTLLFDCGDITGFDVSPSHDKDGSEAVWPDRNVRPTFFWTDSTNGMAYFFVDVSTDPAIPLSDRTKTVVLGGRGIAGASSYAATAAQWKKMRQLATYVSTLANPEPAEGNLYWRVRGVAADRSLTCASAVQALVVDGGTWAVDDLDLSAASPIVRWDHDGQGIAAFKVQFSVSEDFPADSKSSITLPGSLLTAEEYTLSEREVTWLRTLAQRNDAATLYYRIRGDDADKAFMACSPSKSTAAP